MRRGGYHPPAKGIPSRIGFLSTAVLFAGRLITAPTFSNAHSPNPLVGADTIRPQKETVRKKRTALFI